ncbi:MAG: hypothetical protein QXP27_01945, partial [Candidatus Methanomethyliaceae archaeon]
MVKRMLGLHWLHTLQGQYRQAWLRLLVIAGVLLGSLCLGARASARHVVLFVGAGLSLAFLRQPPVGLVVLIVASLLVPFAIGTGTQTDLNVSILLAGLLTGVWILALLAGRRRPVLSRPARPLLALCVVAILAFIAGQIPWIPFAQPAPLRAQLGGLAVFLLS